METISTYWEIEIEERDGTRYTRGGRIHKRDDVPYVLRNLESIRGKRSGIRRKDIVHVMKFSLVKEDATDEFYPTGVEGR